MPKANYMLPYLPYANVNATRTESAKAPSFVAALDSTALPPLAAVVAFAVVAVVAAFVVVVLAAPLPLPLPLPVGGGGGEDKLCPGVSNALGGGASFTGRGGGLCGGGGGVQGSFCPSKKNVYLLVWPVHASSQQTVKWIVAGPHAG